MKGLILLLFCTLLALVITSPSQAQWECLYATYDTDVNGTGNNTPSMAVINENLLLALVTRPGTCSYILPYVNADSMNGRKYWFGYSPADAGVYQVWTDGAFDQVEMRNVLHIVATPDSFIYAASNDVDHNILVFKYVNDTITVVPVGSVYPRQITGTNSIMGIDVDKNGYVYVCNDTTLTGATDDIKIYKPISQWTASHTDPPLKTIDLPNSIYKGISVSPDGKQLFVSDYTNRKVLKYAGSPTAGYTLVPGFNFSLGPADTVTGTALLPGPVGSKFLSPNNILFVACDVYGFTSGTHGTYQYGRIFLVNPNTGARVSSDSSLFIIDQAKWNFSVGGSYTSRGNGDLYGNASMYASTFDVKFDQKGNVYSQSYYGWTIEKWKYNGTLPTITGVEEIGGKMPDSYKLMQNYPNPFNPTTAIEFSVPKSGHVTLKVYDILGKEVMTLVDETKESGSYRVTFDARNLTSGTYFYTLRSGSYSDMKKMLLVK